MDEIKQTEQREERGGARYLWIIVAGVLIIGVGLAYYFSSRNTETITDKSLKGENTIETSATKNTSTEIWTRGTMIAANTTSSDTHKITDNLYRMYTNGMGAIAYAESVDGKTWGSFTNTAVTEDKDKMISNPAILKITDEKWIMIYEQAPRRQPGQMGNVPPGPNSQRNLYQATSSDGKNWQKQGLAIDSSINDNFFASVPDLVLLPDNKVRMYYVCRGDSICSQISSDDGSSWTKEPGFRLTNTAVDPDVIFENNKWVMYYSILDPAKNGLYKAVSNDGLTWAELENQVIAKSSTKNAIVDPDVYKVTDGSYVMNFGESVSNSSTGGEQINLYNATFQGDVIK